MLGLVCRTNIWKKQHLLCSNSSIISMNDAITNTQRCETCISRTVYDWHFVCDIFCTSLIDIRPKIKSKHIYLCRYQFHFRFMMCPLDNWRFFLFFFRFSLSFFVMYEIWAVKVDPDDDWNRSPFGIMAKLWQINWDLNLGNELFFPCNTIDSVFIFFYWDMFFSAF